MVEQGGPTMRVLFIGGTGIISSACSALAVKDGFDLTLLCRGTSSRQIPAAAEVLTADIRDPGSVAAVMGSRTFDVVVDWVAFTPEHIRTDLELFAGRTRQYVFISSASAYQTPPQSLPVTESTPLHNPFWQYSRDKTACEELLVRAYREQGFPATIVRPSHTYDATTLPVHCRYTDIARMRTGKRVVVHGDGTSLWVLTHHRDFAKGFVGLLGRTAAIGQAYHITSDEVLTWNQIYHALAQAAGAEAQLVHVPSSLINAVDPEWGASLLGDKSHSMVFDNSKIKRLVPEFTASISFERGAEEIIAWYDEDPARQRVDPRHEQTIERLIACMDAAWP